VKLLLDQGLPRGAVAELIRLGFDADHVGSLGMAASSDLEILEHARSRGMTVVTLDADFHALLALSNATSPSVVRVRIEGLRSAELAALVERVITLSAADLASGAMVPVDSHGVRVRGLPLVRNPGTPA
jgi:predicted nuclease of predicted toxin-antitoxin system